MSSLPDTADTADGARSVLREAVLDVRSSASEHTAETERAPFETLYRTHFPFVWRSLRRLGVSPSNLDDATQEVFLVVYRRHDTFRPGTSEKAWLFAIAHRVASDQRRTVRRKGGLVPIPESAAANTPDPCERAMQREASDVVLAFLESIDEDLRTAFILSDLEQMTAREIADSVQANINTVYTRIATARKQFAAFVARQRAAMEPLP